MLFFFAPYALFCDILFSLGAKLDQTLYIIAMTLFATISLFSLIFPALLILLLSTKLIRFDAFQNRFDFCSYGLAYNAIYFIFSGLVIMAFFFAGLSYDNRDLNIWYNAAYKYYMMTRTILFLSAIFIGLVVLILSCCCIGEVGSERRKSCRQCCLSCRDKLKDVKKETDLESNGYNKDAVL